ncbi:hypothetical protein KSF_007900 [Reticulibacter mediterranei]|uniref:asparagine synthase (glutamine-hydrolyzing) n=1 Tax=Reticulibacter mediterranei TaxID=2778369 RepID=A0A8J3MYB8_9CHLR|nr:hypothetical protein KSF_007900 [Reticulibacter mediterranei]
MQWLHPDASPAEAHSRQPFEQEYVLLSGLLAYPLSQDLLGMIHASCLSGNYARLGHLSGMFVGCVVTQEKLFLFRSVTSQETIFYRQQGTRVRWSTDPSDLVQEGGEAFDQDALWQCCQGAMVFLYPQLKMIRPGSVVVIDAHGETTHRYEQLVPLNLPRRTSLHKYAASTYHALLQAVQPYAISGRIGVMLSGGIDSTLVLMALVDQGADVVAYHMDTDAPLAREASYAQEVCDRLAVPLVSLSSNEHDDYFSSEWEFPHPYNHVWFGRMQQIAARIRQDGVSLLCNGCHGDMLFGPVRYGLSSIMLGDTSWQEKWTMLQGAFCSRWEWKRLIRSVMPSFSLLDEDWADARQHVDFLVPRPAGVARLPDIQVDLDFLPQEQTADLTIWRPQGIFFCSPLGDKALRQLALRLPDAYRLLPFQGRFIDKPVLRLLLSERFSGQIWRRERCPWLISPDQQYCLSHPHVFANLLGTPETYLIRLHVVDSDQLKRVLADPVLLRRNAETLICSAMTELFLRSQARRGNLSLQGEGADVSLPTC